jgi:hypothetical protein
MSSLSRYSLAMLLVLTSFATVAYGEFWNPFARRPEAEGAPADRLDVPTDVKWFLLPPLRWPERQEQEGPSLWQQMHQSTQRTLAQTREVITAPFEAAAERTSEISIWPRWRGFGHPKTESPPGWFAEEPARPEKPSSVNDFLALPRPE